MMSVSLSVLLKPSPFEAARKKNAKLADYSIALGSLMSRRFVITYASCLMYYSWHANT